jgi:hypothetical protein
MFALSNRRKVNVPIKRGKIGRRKCVFESLETRSLLSANALSEITATPFATLLATSTVSAPYTPAEIRAAYGITGDGTGQTIAIVDAYDNPNIAGDLKAFDSYYGLSDCTFVKVNQKGSTSTTSLPTKNSDWGLEIALDVEWAHAIAPGAKIILVEANSASLSDLLTAVKYASTVASVVSCSWGCSEFSGETQYDSYFSATGVTYVVSSGDTGGTTCWPAVSPKVVSVGGTSLTITSTTSGSTITYSYGSETAWSGSGGGYSQYETEPTWQYTVQSTGRRSTPDVSYDANSKTGFAVYDTYGYSGWVTVGGTSAGAPQWAGIFAIVNQGRAAKGLSTLSNAASDLYALDTTSTYSTDYYDVTSGSAGRYKASSGYDLVTGLGSPKASALVSALVSSSDTVSGSSGGGSSGGGSSGGGGRGGPRGGFGGGPGWGLFGSRLAELNQDAVQMPSTNSLDLNNYAGAAQNSVDPTQLLYAGIGQTCTFSSDSTPTALANIITGSQGNLSSYSQALSSNVFGNADATDAETAHGIAVRTGAATRNTSAVEVVFGAAAPAQSARFEAASDATALAGASTQLRNMAVDACLADSSLDKSRIKADDAPTLPGPEKSDTVNKIQALAAIALAYGGNRFVKSKKTNDDQNHSRVRYL